MNHQRIALLALSAAWALLPAATWAQAGTAEQTTNQNKQTTMKHTLPELPYAKDALEPAMSSETIDYHYGKHLQAYIDNLNALIAGTPYEEMSLEQIVAESTGSLYNNAAQAWNHNLFFLTLTPEPVEMPERLAAKLAEDFGSVEQFRAEFMQAATTLFGAGWAWLAQDGEGKLHILAEQNAGNPLSKGLHPILGVDVWEHSYYIDYRNRRVDYLEAWWGLVDWNKIAERLL